MGVWARAGDKGEGLGMGVWARAGWKGEGLGMGGRDG